MTDNATPETTGNRLGLTASIVSAFVGNNTVDATSVGDLIRATYDALGGLGQPAEVEAPKQEPAVSIRASVKPDYIVCLEDGKKVKMLKRHLMTAFGLSPEEYRAKWGLPADYPMVAPNYSEKRRALAKQIGLGTKGGRRKAVTTGSTATRKKAPKATEQSEVAAA